MQSSNTHVWLDNQDTMRVLETSRAVRRRRRETKEGETAAKNNRLKKS